MRVAWKEIGKGSGSWMARIGNTSVFVHTSLYGNFPVTIKSEERDLGFEIHGKDIGWNLLEAQRIAVEKARELGAKRTHVRREYDEEWLAILAEALYKEISGAYRYEMDMQKQGLRFNAKRIWSTGSLVAFVNQHYLRRDHSPKEISRAVPLVLGRLERAKRIKAFLDEDGNRRWFPES